MAIALKASHWFVTPPPLMWSPSAAWAKVMIRHFIYLMVVPILLMATRWQAGTYHWTELVVEMHKRQDHSC